MRSNLFALLACMVILAASCSPTPGDFPAPGTTAIAAFTEPAVSTLDATATVPLPVESSSATATIAPSDTPPATATPLTPTPAPEPVVRFAAIGDYGLAGKPEADVAALVDSWQPDFVITLGDNNYPYGESETIDANIGQYYHDYIFPYNGDYGDGADRNRFFPSMGNHDWYTVDALPYLDYFTLPGNERYYDFVWGPIHFFALDSDSQEPSGVGRSSTQATWLKDKLAASESVWNIVYAHHPPYSSGDHGPVEWMRWPFKDWGATAYLAGHDHTYERLNVDGFPYFVNGLGGGPIYPFEVILESSQVRYNTDYGAMRVSATSSQIAFEFINRQGEVIDEYLIQAAP